MFSILIRLVMESHIGTLIKVLEVSFLQDVFGLQYMLADQACTGQAIKRWVRGGRRSVITTSRPAGGLVTTEPAGALTDWPSLTRQTWYWERDGRGTHCVLPCLPPPTPGKLKHWIIPSRQSSDRSQYFSLLLSTFQSTHYSQSQPDERRERVWLTQTVPQMLGYSFERTMLHFEFF